MNTRSKAGVRQTLTPAASPEGGSPNHPRRESRSQQAPRAEVRSRTKVNGGHHSTSLAGTTISAPSRKCRSDCKTCPDLIIENQFNSSVTGRTYQVINPSNESINCKIQNYVYLLSCKLCYVQYVGESVVPLHLRMNIHRKGKSGCEILIDHFKNCCPNASFTIRVIEVLPGNGYKNGSMDQEMTNMRKKREDHWMKTLRTIYPYGLCDKFKKEGKISSDAPKGKLFPPIPRYGERLAGLSTRTRNGSRNVNESTNFFNIFERHFYELYLSFEPKSRASSIRKYLEQLTRKEAKKIVADIVDELPSCPDDKLRWYEYTLDVINTKRYKEINKKPKKAPKYIFPMKFKNKGLDAIKLGRIFRRDEVRSLLPAELNTDENIPSVVYSLEGTIRNRIFNYKDTVSSIKSGDTLTYGSGIESCDCHSSEFCDPNHGHIAGVLTFEKPKH